MRTRPAPVAVLLPASLALAVMACGGKGGGVVSPSQPLPSPTPTPPVAKEVLVETLRDAEGDPIRDAQFTVNGPLVGATASDGKLAITVRAGDPVRVTSACLQFDTVWRESTDALLRLNCLDSGFVRGILFDGEDAPDDARLSPLTRPKPDVPGGMSATLNIKVESAHDYFSPDVLPDAVARSNAFTEGVTAFAVGAGKQIVHYRLNAADPYFAPGAAGANAAAYAQSRYENGWIVETSVVIKDFLTDDNKTLCTRSQAIQLFTHENGHALGLRHHDRAGVMNPTQTYWLAGPVSEERRAALLATYRPAGTRWVDNQSGVATGTERGRSGWGERQACPRPPAPR
jgi:hypothetical protein